jgi:hypothetical protein
MAALIAGIERVKAKEAAQEAAEEEAGVAFVRGVSGGLCRQNLTSTEWHAANPDAARHLFGFKSWRETKAYMLCFWPDLDIPEGLEHTSDMTPFEQALICKMRFRRALTEKALGLMWGRSESSISRYTNKWAPRWGRMGQHLSILHIDAGFLEATCPQAYKDGGLEKICAVPDGKDFMIHTPRSNTLITRASRSDKVEHSATRVITWSTPAGLCFEHTDMYLARVSEKRLVELWGPRLAKCPPGWKMLSDRGFAGTARYYPNFNAQITPRFLAGRKQFAAEEVASDHGICKLRYTCEVAFSRVVLEEALQDVIPQHFYRLLEDMNQWAHANINIMKPLMR